MEPGWNAGGDRYVEFRHGCGMAARVVERRRRQEGKKEEAQMGRMKARVREGFWVGRGCWSPTCLLSGLP